MKVKRYSKVIPWTFETSNGDQVFKPFAIELRFKEERVVAGRLCHVFEDDRAREDFIGADHVELYMADANVQVIEEF